MKVLGVIPARYKSSRFPGKPLADICGKPMIWWVYNQALKVEGLFDVVVATDDERIVQACNANGINVMLTSDNCRTGTDRVAEVAKKIEADFYVNIQGDEPLIEPETINAIINFKKSHPDAEIVNTMTVLKDEKDLNVNTIVKVVNSNEKLLYLSRSPVPYPKNGEKISYMKHLGLYGLSRRALEFFARAERTPVETIEDIEMLRFIENGYNISIISVESESIGVDRECDIKKVEEYINRVTSK